MFGKKKGMKDRYIIAVRITKRRSKTQERTAVASVYERST